MTPKLTTEQRSEIARAKWQRLIDQHWNGNVDAYNAWFTHLGMMAADPFPQNGAMQRWHPPSHLLTDTPAYALEALERYRRSAITIQASEDLEGQHADNTEHEAHNDNSASSEAYTEELPPF